MAAIVAAMQNRQSTVNMAWYICMPHSRAALWTGREAPGTGVLVGFPIVFLLESDVPCPNKTRRDPWTKGPGGPLQVQSVRVTHRVKSSGSGINLASGQKERRSTGFSCFLLHDLYFPSCTQLVVFDLQNNEVRPWSMPQHASVTHCHH